MYIARGQYLNLITNACRSGCCLPCSLVCLLSKPISEIMFALELAGYFIVISEMCYAISENYYRIVQLIHSNKHGFVENWQNFNIFPSVLTLHRTINYPVFIGLKSRFSKLEVQSNNSSYSIQFNFIVICVA